MKNRINLYHPEFHPKLRLLSLTIVIASWVLTAILCGFLYFYFATEQQNFQAEIGILERDKQQQKILVTELQIAVDSLKIDPVLLQKVENNQQLVNLKKRVLDELSGREQSTTQGYSNLMIDLASHNQTGLWLTHINLNGAKVELQGATTDSALVPKWLSSLGQTDYFNGQEFADTRLYLDSDKQLKFVVSSAEESNPEAGTSNE
ncbi:MAG: PilN domain-containing protein [Paraglaciecola sp.]|uniref:PilN domain-containing protein n=1 Tax=Paraglaciecola sp. TaxID=1920173 RepID=UPI0032997936